MPNVLLQIADTGPLESLVYMFDCVGWKCYLPSDNMRSLLRRYGGLVLSPADLERTMGYAKPKLLPTADDFHGIDLYVDVKAHQIAEKFRKDYPKLPIVWYRINGGKPEHVPGCGDEVNPGCPIITPNQWYLGRADSYVFWPRYMRAQQLDRPNLYDRPVCLIHNVSGWGYQDLVTPMKSLGVRFYGRGSPDGVVQHAQVSTILQNAIAMVHLKSNDAPGYAILEAMSSGCPVVCSRRLVWRCNMAELLISDETCLAFDRETHDPLAPRDVADCMKEVSEHLMKLRDFEYNYQIGEAGRKRLELVQWNDEVGFARWLRSVCV